VKEGKVDYSRINKNREELNGLITQISSAHLDDESDETKKAFYINAYNLIVINQIVDNYPVTSPMDITGFFKITKYLVAGHKITLDYLENSVLRKKHTDPRLHFVLVCGAISCPPITNFAYFPNNTDGLMDMQTRKAINSNDFIYEKEGVVYVSEIFKWFADDFGKELDYINQYKFIKVEDKTPIKYYDYNWTLNDTDLKVDIGNGDMNENQVYNAGSLLKKGQIDLTLFNSVYTENKTNWEGIDYSGYRTTFAGTLIQFTYGTSENARMNLGVDVNIKGSGTGPDSSFSDVFTPLALENSPSTRFGIATIAPKIKLSPLKNVKEFTMQSSFVITLPKAPEGVFGESYWIEWDRHVWWNQFFYSKSFAKDKFQVFGEADLLFRFKRYSGQGSHLDIPLSLFFSYFPNKKVTLYAMSQHTQRTLLFNPLDENDNQTDWVIPANFTASGLGAKYQINLFFIAELLYTNFRRAENAGFGQTFNLGLKYIR